MNWASRIVMCLVFLLSITSSLYAAPIDLNTFSADPSVWIDDVSISFVEDGEYAALYGFNDNFLVSADATVLSFDWGLMLSTEDLFDYLVFEVNYSTLYELFLPEEENFGNGHYEFDLTPFRNQELSLAWGLIWGGDSFAGSTGRVWNIDVATETSNAPVPEPATMLLLGTGLLGLAGARKIRRKA